VYSLASYCCFSTEFVVLAGTAELEEELGLKINEQKTKYILTAIFWGELAKMLTIQQ
jgi:hypothetical protein